MDAKVNPKANGHPDSSRVCLLLFVAEQLVDNRPGRIEPRAIKRRPKTKPNTGQPIGLHGALIIKIG
jgi:hypothetical protein